MRAKFLGSTGLFCLVSICKFGSFKNPFAMINSLSELYFRIRRFILLVQMKKVISMKYGSSTSNWKPWRWVRLDLIFSITDIYINSNLNPLTKLTNSSRSTKLKDLSNNNEDCSNQHKNSHKLCNETRHPVVNVNENWDSNMIRISQWGEGIVEQILASEEINKSKRAGLWESQSGIRVGKLTI